MLDCHANRDVPIPKKFSHATVPAAKEHYQMLRKKRPTTCSTIEVMKK